MLTFNADHALAEAVVRGFRSGYLTEVDYHHLTLCDNMEDVKLNLQETDYSGFLQEEALSSLSPSFIGVKCREKLAEEFNYLRSLAVQPMATFLDYITYDYMISNLVLVIKAVHGNPDVDIKELLEQFHPLGKFSEPVVRNISQFEHSSSGFTDLYQLVLIDTPIGPYFVKFLESNAENEKKKSGNNDSLEVEQIHDTLEDIIRGDLLENSLRKYYLEDFMRLCEDIGGETAEVMSSILKVRADEIAISITRNSLGTQLATENMQEERYSLLPSIGYLYPAGTAMLKPVKEMNELKDVLKPFDVYTKILEAEEAEERDVYDSFYILMAKMLERAFEGQFHFGMFYAYVLLKEQEIRNVQWICECIVQGAKQRCHDHFIPLFPKTS